MSHPHGKREAQRQADRIRVFRRELDELTAAGVLALGDDRRAAINAHLDQKTAELAAHFDVDINESQKLLSLGMRIVSALGGLALGAAVFFLSYRFWGVMATPLQIVILIAAPLIGLAAMDLVSRKERTFYFTVLIGLVTFACFI